MMLVEKKGLKEIILDRLDEADIYSRYIGSRVVIGRTIKSPLREGDKHPSFSIFKATDGRIMFKDHAGESGDIFKLVMLMFNINFNEACQKIAFDFNLDTNPLFERIARIKNRSSLISIPTLNFNKEKEEKKAEIVFKGRPVNELYGEEQAFFNVHCIDTISLGLFDGRPLDEFQVGKYHWKTNGLDIGFVFKFPSGNVKIYRPYAQKYGGIKHIGNAGRDDVFGLDFLRHQVRLHKNTIDAIIICAGQKDTLALQTFLNRFHSDKNIFCIALNSESCNLPPWLFLELRSYTNNIFSCYDSDAVGMKYAKKLFDEYQIHPLMDLDWMAKNAYKDIAIYIQKNRQQPPLTALSDSINAKIKSI